MALRLVLALIIGETLSRIRAARRGVLAATGASARAPGFTGAGSRCRSRRGGSAAVVGLGLGMLGVILGT
jgi:hypothetical protein